jgi:CDP-6-deoxy-D-xylo-4-hexulose-3-dehydrase
VVTTEQRTAGLRYPLAHVTYGEAEIAAVLACLREGRTTMGPRVAAFEARFAQTVGAHHAVMVNSGSSADLLCAFSLGPSHRMLDEILVPAVTWPTQVWSCLTAGYRVRLVDTDPATLQMDLDDLERKLSGRTAAVFAVHVLGNVGDLDRLTALCAEHGVPLLEDGCEALGSRWKGKHVGTFGKAAAFSFFFSHLLSTMEGGMVVCDSPSDNRYLRLWRSHGWEPEAGNRFRFPTWGMNVRPMEVQGAFGLEQIKKAETFLSARRRNFGRLEAATSLRYGDHLATPEVLPHASPGWHGFPLLVKDDFAGDISKEKLCRYLESRGVETRPLIAGNLARQPGVEGEHRITAGDLPGADAVHERAFYIGLASHDDPEGTGYVGECVEDFIEGGKRG